MVITFFLFVFFLASCQTKTNLENPLCCLASILVHVCNQLLHQTPLQNVLPEDPWQLCDDGNDGKDEWKPDVIVSCANVVLILAALILADAT